MRSHAGAWERGEEHGNEGRSMGTRENERNEDALFNELELGAQMDRFPGGTFSAWETAPWESRKMLEKP
jgi:hypothetical protein